MNHERKIQVGVLFSCHRVGASSLTGLLEEPTLGSGARRSGRIAAGAARQMAKNEDVVVATIVASSDEPSGG